VIGALPAALPASVVVVQHLAAAGTMRLPEVLARTGAMKVSWAEHGDALVPGHVLVGPPGVHVMVERDRTVLVGGPRENRARPAINRLFRSAARHHGGRAIGVLLTGMLDDGVSGLAAIKKVGGVTLVQDPSEAEYPSMPRSAVDAGVADHVLPLADLGPALVRLVHEQAAPAPVPSDVAVESSLDAGNGGWPDAVDTLGVHTAITCPVCGGPTWEVGPAGARMYRCFLGHAESAASLLSSQSDQVEHALRAAVRALQDRAMVYDKLSRDAHAMRTPRSGALYQQRAAEARAQADHARQLLVDLQRYIEREDQPPSD